jgi:hypothetical protein
MTRITSLMGAVGFAALSAACSDDGDVVAPWPVGVGSSRGGSPGSSDSDSAGAAATGGNGGGGAGAGGSSNRSENPTGAGGGSGDARSLDGGVLVDAGDAGVPIRCDVAAECNDANACTTETCVNDLCVFTPVAIGTACGDTTTMNECTAPDSCDGNGVCLGNHQPLGTLCDDGQCNARGVCDCAVERVTALPYGQPWRTTEDAEVDVFNPNCQTCDNTLDHVVVFTAPATATYRITATSGANVELAVLQGDCSAPPVNPVCGENIDEDDEDWNDQLDLDIAQGATVTIVLGEQCEENGGQGTLTIELAPGD